MFPDAGHIEAATIFTFLQGVLRLLSKDHPNRSVSWLSQMAILFLFYLNPRFLLVDFFHAQVFDTL
jgi:hypothetical protein